MTTAEMTRRIIGVCKSRGWKLDWQGRGVYLHLEASELIEAVRGNAGKIEAVRAGGDPGDVAGEAADVFLVLLSIIGTNGVSAEEMISRAEKRIVELESGVGGRIGEA